MLAFLGAVLLLTALCALLGPQAVRASSSICTISITSPAANASFPYGQSVTVTGTLGGPAIDTVTGALLLDGRGLLNFTTAPQTLSTTVPSPSSGTHTLSWSCSASGQAGSGSNSGSQTFTVAAAPTPTPTPFISNISPASGPVGTSVTISGGNFGSSAGTVRFNGTQASATWGTSTIYATVPSGATTGSVSVTTAGSQSASGPTFTVTAPASPTPTPFISNISPASGPVGTSVTISGGNFGSTAGTVKFNGTQASATWGTSTIYATVPSGATTGSVSVTTAGSQSASGPTFTVTAPASPTPTPFISGISPASGPVGTSVTISGGNFGSTAGTVRFNGTQASATWGTSTIYATVPSGATTGSVSVTTAGSQSASGPTFTVTAPSYTISGTVTANGSGLAGVTMTLSGSQSGSTTTGSGGGYSFSVAAGGSYTVTPSKAYYGFTPASASFSNLSGNQTAYFTAWPLTTTLSNLTRPGNTAIYIGDDFQIVVTGPPNQAVTVQTSQNGGPYSSPAQLGTTNNNGNGSGSYTYAANAYVGLTTGSWSALWSVGTVAAPLETFSVLGNTIQGTVTGGGTATISESWANPGTPPKTITGSTTTVSGGSYTLSVGPGGSKYVVTPSEAGYTFSPPSQSFGSLTGNLTGVNFTALMVQLSNLTRPGNSAIYIGDDFQVVVTGPNGAVMLQASQNGGPYCPAYQVGTINGANGSGSFTLTANAYVGLTTGSWSEIWSVNGASATLGFSVLGNTISGQVTAGGTGLSQVLISESWNNPAGKTITGSTNPTYTDANGNYTLSVGPNGTNYVVTPSKANYTFSSSSGSASASFSSLTGNLTGVNFTATAAPPTVQLTVNGQPWSAGATYHVGDYFIVTLTGPVGAVVTEGGWSPGSIPGSGTLTISGTWTAAYVGSYSETWYVGGVVATPNPLSFSVACSATMPCIYSLALAPSGSDSNNGTSTDTSRVQITGTNFGAAESDPVGPNTSAIMFPGANGATVQAPSVHNHTWCNDGCDWSNTVIHVQVPEGARTGNVTVWVNGQSSNGVPFTLTTPSVTSLSASSAAVGSVVTIYGSHFADSETKTGDAVNDSAVLFNGVAAPSVHSCDDNSSGVDRGCRWHDTAITVTVPAAATTGNVQVTVNGQISNAVGPFTPTPAPTPGPSPSPTPGGTPTITSISPTSGVPGTVVTILGSGFGGGAQASVQRGPDAARLAQQAGAEPLAARPRTLTMPPNSYVLFGTTPGTVIGWSDSEIDVAVPNLPVSTQAPIVVISDGVEAVWGPGVPASGFSFTVLPGAPAPYITQIVPQVLAYGSTGILTFYGQNLSGATDVSFGNLPYSFPITIFLPPAVNANGTEVTFQYQAGWATPTSVSAQVSLVLGGATSTNALTLYLSTTTAATASILMGGSDITGTTQTVVVGQQISLAGRVNGGNTVLNWWTIPGTIIDQNGYTPGSQPGSPVVTENMVTFYWIAPGTFEVAYLGIYGGNPASTAAATFNVVGPTVASPAGWESIARYGQTIAALIQPVGSVTGVMLLRDSTNTQYPNYQGIAFYPTVTPPDGYQGTLIWAQLLDQMTITGNNLPIQCSAVPSSLDNGYPYHGPNDVCTYGPNQTPTVYPVCDNPFLPLNPAYIPLAETFSARMFLLWQPTLAGSTPAPLGYVSWSWSGTATFTNTWSLTVGNPVTSPNWGAFTPSTTYPTWSQTFPAGCNPYGS